MHHANPAYRVALLRVPLSKVVKGNERLGFAVRLVEDQRRRPHSTVVGRTCHFLSGLFFVGARDGDEHVKEGAQEPPKASPSQAVPEFVVGEKLPREGDFLALVPVAQEAESRGELCGVHAFARELLEGREERGQGVHDGWWST